jgi:hypothetical protein
MRRMLASFSKRNENASDLLSHRLQEQVGTPYKAIAHPVNIANKRSSSGMAESSFLVPQMQHD